VGEGREAAIPDAVMAVTARDDEWRMYCPRRTARLLL
jgi:hypothetical protein